MSNGNSAEWSPIWSVMIQVITKSDDRVVGVRFVYHEYDYRPNWTVLLPTNHLLLLFESYSLKDYKPAYTPYSQMAANLGRARGQTWKRGVLG